MKAKEEQFAAAFYSHMTREILMYLISKEIYGIMYGAFCLLLIVENKLGPHLVIVETKYLLGR